MRLNSHMWTLVLSQGAARRLLPGPAVNALHTLNCAGSLLYPLTVAWAHPESPVTTFLLLFLSSITFLKLVSYGHANWDYRQAFYKNKKSSSGLDESDKPVTGAGGGEFYPGNLTLGNTAFFLMAPTLCYQLNYPRSPGIRWKYVISLLIR
jgi:diacylglycerol O-acyltransferase 1